MTPSLTLVMPVYNEEQNLGDILKSILAYCENNSCNLIAIDDGSTDGSAHLLKEASLQHSRMTVLTHHANRGYGAALKHGLAKATSDLVMTIDADGQHSSELIGVLVEAQKNANADLGIGSRSGKQPSVGIPRSLGKAFIRFFARVYLKVRLRDLNSGLKLYRTEVVQRYLSLCPDGMSFSDVLTLEILQEGHIVVEQPVQVIIRKSGKAKTSVVTGFETLLSVLNVIIMFHPMRFFLPIAFGLAISGALWGIPFVLRERGIPVASMLMILAGVITFYAGLITEQLSLLIRQGMYSRNSPKTSGSNE